MSAQSICALDFKISGGARFFIVSWTFFHLLKNACRVKNRKKYRPFSDFFMFIKRHKPLPITKTMLSDHFSPLYLHMYVEKNKLNNFLVAHAHFLKYVKSTSVLA